jgi:GGDEF domain-containing protein
MLLSAAQTLSKILRPADFLGRWQGDQLLAILVGDVSGGGRVHPMGKLLGLSRIHWWGDSVPVSVVIAGAEPETGDTIESLVCRAQAKLMTGESEKKPVIETASRSKAED